METDNLASKVQQIVALFAEDSLWFEQETAVAGRQRDRRQLEDALGRLDHRPGILAGHSNLLAATQDQVASKEPAAFAIEVPKLVG
jgi:hypothetical protein